MRTDVSSFEAKRLRRGDYVPDMLLDLHGLTQQQAKLELAALLEACRRQHIRCACVMHGHGKHILKQRVPMWLAQHPDVMAFHQAPKEWGGDSALLVLGAMFFTYVNIGAYWTYIELASIEAGLDNDWVESILVWASLSSFVSYNFV